MSARLARLKLRSKLLGTALLATMAVLLVLAQAAGTMHARMFQDRMASLQVALDAARGELAALDAQVAAGTLSREAALKQFRAFVHAYRFAGGTGYLITLDPTGVTIENGADASQTGQRTHNLDTNGTLIVDTILGAVATADTGTATYHYRKPGGTEPLPKTVLVQRHRPWDMVLATGTYTDDLEADFLATTSRLAGAAAVVLLGLLVCLWAIGRDLAGALGRTRAAMSRLAAGDLAVVPTDAGRSDEIGDMARALDVFRQNAQRMETLQHEQDALKAQAARDQRDARRAMADQFERSVGNVVGNVSDLSARLDQAARSMAAVASGAQSAADAARTASGEASGNVQTVAAATEELTASLGEVTAQVRQCSSLASAAVERARNTDAVVKQLFDGAQKIGDVIGLIQSIASQTNLLALNATIEAARAGDAGKGFAVVASEVKNLAGQTARATEEIAGQIVAIQAATNEAVSAIRTVGVNVEQMSSIAAAIAGAVQEQNTATQEIAANAVRAAGGTETVVGNVGQVARASGEVSAASQDVQHAAVDLSHHADLLRREVRTFLDGVRAA